MENFKKDWKRYYAKEWSFLSVFSIIKSQPMRYIYFGRKQFASKTAIGRKIYGVLSNYTGKKMGNEMGFGDIGDGLLLAHPYGITFNAGAKAGENLTLFKGSTVGSVRGKGAKAGVPVLGDRVTVCANATVCGNITIGSDVLIAPNAFVNFDVPDNSVVIGNPGVIHHKENASKYYI